MCVSDELSALFADVGLEATQCDYVLRELINKKEGISVPRVFVQGIFHKPNPADCSTDGASGRHDARVSCQNADGGSDASCVDTRWTCQADGSEASSGETRQSDDSGDVTNKTDDDRNVSSGIVTDSLDDSDRLNLTDDDKLHEIP